MPTDSYIPGADRNLQDAGVVAALFNDAAELYRTHPLRQGATIHLPAPGQLTIAGDLHDHASNLLRVLKLAQLHASSGNHLVIQEIVHGPNFVNGMDLSVRALARAAALKLDFPAQVHQLQANHELAQRNGEGILKNSTNVIAAFDEGIDYIYGSNADAVRQAMHQFIASLPLALRCERGIMVTHSLPSPSRLDRFDPEVIGRMPTDQDLAKGGSGHMLVWGRNQTQALADRLAQAWDCRLFVMGHQHADMGFDQIGDTMLIVNSDHEHGVALILDLDAAYDMQALTEQVVPLNAVML